MMDQLKNYNAGSPDYKKLEELMLKKQGDVNLKVNIQKKDFMEQEERIYYTGLAQIDDAVRSLAARYNLILVLRFSGDGIDPSDRNDILRGINKQIVYYDQRMDITTLVLNELTRSTSVQPNPQMSNVPVPPAQWLVSNCPPLRCRQKTLALVDVPAWAGTAGRQRRAHQPRFQFAV